MYCLSKDGLRLINAKNFYIEKLDYAPVLKKPSEYIIYADNACVMEAFNTLKEAKHKLKRVLTAAGASRKTYEF